MQRPIRYRYLPPFTSFPSWLRRLTLAAALAAALFTQGCQACAKFNRHLKSSFVGLERQVTLYDCQGRVIGRWRGRFMVETEAGGAAWIGEDGAERKIAGTFLVEEVRP